LTYRVRLSPRAAEQISEAHDWWVANRLKAPLAFVEDIESAFQLLAELPGAGETVASRALPKARRLSRIRYFLYYTLHADGTIEILALWHTSRGKPPKLR